MRYTGRKGWHFSNKDVWSLNETLSPVILEGLKKFREMDRDGIPSKVLMNFSDSGLINKMDENYFISDEDLDKALSEWNIILDKMIYAFDFKNIPKLKDYNYSINLISEEKDQNGLIPAKFEIDNQKEFDRYKEDQKKNKELSQEGYELFGIYFSSLWD